LSQDSPPHGFIGCCAAPKHARRPKKGSAHLHARGSASKLGAPLQSRLREVRSKKVASELKRHGRTGTRLASGKRRAVFASQRDTWTSGQPPRSTDAREASSPSYSMPASTLT